MSQSIYKLTDSNGNTRYEMMSGERAQRKNHKREEAKLPTRWLPVELEDVPNDAQIRDVSGNMFNAGELKGEDESVNEGLSDDQIDDRLASVEPRQPIQAKEQTPPPPSQPPANPVPVDGEALAKAEAVQPLPTAQTPASVAPVASAELPKLYVPQRGWGGGDTPNWHKGEPAVMDDEDLLAVWMEYETDPRKDSDIPRDEWNYRQDVRAEYQERVKMAVREANRLNESSAAEMPNGSGKFVDLDEGGTPIHGADDEPDLTEEQVNKMEGQLTRTLEETPETIQTYQLVGTARVAMMTTSEAKLLNANMDGEWIYAPELREFAKPRKDENGEPKKRQKWRGISGTNLLMLCGSEGLSRNVAREVVKRLTGLEAADSTANAKMSEGRQDNTDLPDPGREGWAEFYHVVGEVKKTIGENGSSRMVAVPETDLTGTTPTATAKRIDLTPELTEGDKEIGRVQTVISAYRLKLQTLLDEMQDELLKALTD